MPLTHTKDLFAKAPKGKYLRAVFDVMLDSKKSFDIPSSNRSIDGKRSPSKIGKKSNRGRSDNHVQASPVSRIDSSCYTGRAMQTEVFPRKPKSNEFEISPFGDPHACADGCIDEHSLNMFVTNNLAFLEIPHRTILNHLEICSSCRSREDDLRSLFAQFVGSAKACSRKAMLLTENCVSQSA